MSKTKFIAQQVFIFFAIIGVMFCIYWLTKPDESLRYRETALMDLFKAGGIYSYLIAFLGFNAIVYGIMDFFKFRTGNLASPQTASKFDELLSNNDHAKVLELCTATDANLAEIVQSGFDMNTEDMNSVANTMEGTLQRNTFKIANAPNKYLFIALLSSIFGVLGTTLGILETFGIIQTKLCASPADLAMGIEKSLVSISIGCIVLLLSVFLYFLNKTTINYYLLELGILAERIIFGMKK